MSRGYQRIKSFNTVQIRKEDEWRDKIPMCSHDDPCELCGRPFHCFLIMGHAVHAKCLQRAVEDPSYGKASTYNDLPIEKFV